LKVLGVDPAREDQRRRMISCCAHDARNKTVKILALGAMMRLSNPSHNRNLLLCLSSSLHASIPYIPSFLPPSSPPFVYLSIYPLIYLRITQQPLFTSPPRSACIHLPVHISIPKLYFGAECMVQGCLQGTCSDFGFGGRFWRVLHCVATQDVDVQVPTALQPLGAKRSTG
jgi:hypothetical protein